MDTDNQRIGVATRGLLWLLAQTAGGRGVVFLSQIALARLLSPHDFGSIGLTYTVTAVIGSLTASGIGDVLVQRSKTFRLWAWPGLWIDMVLALVGAALVVALAPLGARLYRAPEITGLARILALAMPLSALSTIPLSGIRASLNFRFFAAVGAAETVAIQILSVLLAWNGMGAYSFVIPLPVVAGIKAVLLWAMVRPRLPRTRPRRAWFYLVGSGFWIWGFRLLIGLISQGDYFVLGLTSSSREVGFYFFAFRLAAQPLQILAANLLNVMFPVLAQMRLAPEEQSRATLRVSKMFAVIIFFGADLQAALAPTIIHTLFHHRWDAAILLSQILSVGLSFDVACWVPGALINARGEFRKNFYFACCFAPCFFGLVALGAWQERALGVAVAVAVYYAVVGSSYSFMALRGYGVSTRDLFGLCAMPPLLSGCAVISGWEGGWLLFGDHLPAVQACATLMLSTAFYYALLKIFMPTVYREMRVKAGSLFLRFRG